MCLPLISNDAHPWICLDTLDDLHNVLIHQQMLLAHSLWPVSHTGPPHERVLEVLHHRLVDLVTEVLHTAVLAVQDHRLVEVRELAWETQRDGIEVYIRDGCDWQCS